MLKRVILPAAVLLLVACASGSAPTSSGRDRNLISSDEIASLPVTSAHDLVNRLRPTWLRNRGPTSMSSGGPVVPLVYIDGVPSGGLEALLRISTQIVREIRFINGRDATTKWGMGHGGGVILVVTGR